MTMGLSDAVAAVEDALFHHFGGIIHHAFLADPPGIGCLFALAEPALETMKLAQYSHQYNQ